MRLVRFTATKHHVAAGMAGAAMTIALIGGSVAVHDLVTSSAHVATASDRYGVLQAQARAHPTARQVPFLGPFARTTAHGKKCGPAVRIMEGALRRTTPPVRTTKAASCVGLATERQIKRFQHRHGIPATGTYGLRTHLALSHAYSKAQRAGLIYIARLAVLRAERAAVLRIVAHSITVAGGSLAYCQSSSRSYFPSWPRIPPCTDCSGFATWVMYQAGVGPVVGYYGPGSVVGWTGTLSRQGRFVPSVLARLAIGDLIFHGSGGYGHVEVYIGHGQSVGHGSVGVHIHAWNYQRFRGDRIGMVRRMIN